MKRLFTFVTALSIFFIGANMMVAASYENDYLNLHEDNNYIFANVGDNIDLSSIRFADYYGKVLLTEGSITNVTDGLTVQNQTLVVSSPGVLSFDFTYAGLQNTIYVMSNESSSDTYTLYEQNFDTINDGYVPQGINVTDGSIEVQNHKLEINSVTETTKLQFPALLNVFSSYSISMDVSFDQVNSSSRWMTVMFRGTGYNFYQVVLRQGGEVANGIELVKSTNGAITSLQLAAFSSEFTLGQSYHLDVAVSGNAVSVSIDGTEYISFDGLVDYQNGYIGMQANGNIVSVDNIEINYDNSNGAEHQFMSVPKLFELESNANQTPTLVREMKTIEDIEVLSSVLRPHVAIFTLNNDLNVVDEAGDVLMSLEDALIEADVVVIPAFRISNETQATELAQLLEQKRILDVYVMSDNYEYILAAHNEYTYIKGVLEVPYDESKPVLSDTDLYTIKVQALTSYSFVVWMDSEYLNQSAVRYLHQRLLQVWADDSNASLGEATKVIFSGADGVVTTNEFQIITILNGLPENTVLTEPMLIGHRGMPSRGPENSVESSQLAIDAGADAVECDIRLSLDDKIVVMHDPTTTRTTGTTLTVSSALYDDITALEMINNFPELGTVYVPGLEDYFIQFQDQDMMLIIEIKDTDLLIVDKLSDLLDDYPNMRDNIIVISFDPNQMYRMKAVLPDIPLAYLNGSFSAGSVEQSIENHIKLYVPMGAISNVNYDALWDDYLLAFHHRGISTTTWTVNDTTKLQNYYIGDIRGITTDISYIFSDTWNQFKLDETSYAYDLNQDVQNDSFTIRGTMYTNGGLEYPISPVYSIIDDGGTELTISDTQVITGATNPGIAYIQTMFQTSLPNGSTYYLFGDVIKVNVFDSTVTCDVDQTLIDGECIANEPTSITGVVIGIVSSSIIVLAVAGFVLVKKGILKF